MKTYSQGICKYIYYFIVDDTKLYNGYIDISTDVPTVKVLNDL